MATQYHVYANDGAGGPIDYTTVVATTASLAWSSGALAYPGDWRFGVRAFDTVSSLEESNVDASVRLVLDAAGVDITNRPAPVVGLAVATVAGGSLRVTWFAASPTTPNPTGYRVWCQAGAGPVNFAATPDATVPFDATAIVHAATIGPLTHGAACVVAVRAHTATMDDGSAAEVNAVPDATGPDAVDSLAAEMI